MREQRIYNLIGAVCTVLCTVPVMLALVEAWQSRRWVSVAWDDDDEQHELEPTDPFAPTAAYMRAMHDFTR